MTHLDDRGGRPRGPSPKTAAVTEAELRRILAAVWTWQEVEETTGLSRRTIKRAYPWAKTLAGHRQSEPQEAK